MNQIESIELAAREGLITETEAGRRFQQLIDTDPTLKWMNDSHERTEENLHYIDGCIEQYEQSQIVKEITGATKKLALELKVPVDVLQQAAQKNNIAINYQCV